MGTQKKQQKQCADGSERRVEEVKRNQDTEARYMTSLTYVREVYEDGRTAGIEAGRSEGELLGEARGIARGRAEGRDEGKADAIFDFLVKFMYAKSIQNII